MFHPLTGARAGDSLHSGSAPVAGLSVAEWVRSLGMGFSVTTAGRCEKQRRCGQDDLRQRDGVDDAGLHMPRPFSWQRDVGCLSKQNGLQLSFGGS